VLLCFGEIDCRVHLLKQAETQGRDIESVVKDCVSKYVEVINEVKEKGFTVLVWGPVPTASDDVPMDRFFPRFGTETERNKATKYFNDMLRDELSRIGVTFVTIFDKLVTETLKTRTEYQMDGIHLSQNAMPFALAALQSVGFCQCDPNSAIPRRLHIGGTVRVDGWEVLNVNPGPHVDHVCDAKDLSHFSDNTFSEIYASHVVEHFDYVNELIHTLKEWGRVLVPGGRVLVSVPDLDILAKLFVSSDRLTANERFHVMRMMFGGHVDRYDYHLVGLNMEFLTYFLHKAGFINVARVKDFGIFDDASSLVFKGTHISLNVVAEKPVVAP
jgi:predicted SAM-dependent methyltransferase